VTGIWIGQGRHGANPTVPAVLCGLGVSYVATVLWQVLIARWRGQGPVRDYAIGIRWIDVPLGIGVGIAAILLILGGSELVATLTGMKLQSTAGDLLLGVQVRNALFVVLLLAIAAAGPLVEELHFRGMWFAALDRRLGPLAAIVGSGAIFAVAHLEAVRLLGLFLCGVLFGVVRWRFRRLGPSFVAHLLLNALSALSVLSVAPR
jgi:membrane protease YdiL (CAAX protease family)